MRRTRIPALQVSVGVLAALLAAAIAACGGQASPSASTRAASGGAAASVVIQSPPSNVQVAVGQSLEIVTTAVGSDGIGWIDLQVGGAVVSRATAPSAMTSFSAVHVWTASVIGSIDVVAVAYGADGTGGQPFGITVFAVAAGQSVPPIPTFDGPLPTYVVTAVATGALPPATSAARTYPPATGYPTSAPYSAGATYVAAAPTYVAATPTSAAPTPTYAATPTSASATATVSPTNPIAPPDTAYSWVIPYKGSNEITDFVSYPGGDVEDRVNFDVSGMSASPPGNTGHLNVFVTCDGIGVQNIQVKVGQATFPCNTQVIASQLITDESRTGSIRIVAVGAAYVRWTLNGNVTP